MRFRAFSRQQRRVLTWWCSAEGQSREAVICDGAVRSGKTLCMGLAFFLWATACFDGMAFGLCGKTITALRRNLLREVLPTLGALGFQWREQASQNRLTVRLGGKENTFYLFGGRDEGSAALIQGITLAGVLLDEAALMPRSFVEQACAHRDGPRPALVEEIVYPPLGGHPLPQHKPPVEGAAEAARVPLPHLRRQRRVILHGEVEVERPPLLRL